MIFKKYLTFFLLLGIPFVFDRRPCYSVELSYSDLAVTYALNKEKFIPLKRNSTIELFSARNEAVFFQVALTSFERSGILKIQKKGLSGEGKRTRVNVYTVERCQTQFDSDCLIPVTGLGELQASRGELSVFFIELKVPEGVPQGEYRGAIQFFLGQSNVAVVNYKLKVHPFTLPKQPSLKVDLNNYGAGFVSEAGYSPGSEDAAFMIQKYYRFVSEHGMVFNPLPYKSQRGNPHPGMAPILEGEGENIKVKDWTAYNRLYGPIFDGTLFASKIPIEHQFVPFNPEWPSDFKNFFSDRKRYETEWERIAKEFLLHFKKMGWDQTTFQVYLNQNPKPNNKIPWNLDEPKGDEDYKALRYYADLTHTVFSKDSPFKFRIDISHFYCDKHRGNEKKDFRVNSGAKLLLPVDIWMISKHSLDSRVSQEKALELKKNGREIYEYMSGHRMPLIGKPLLKAVQYGWNAWLRGEDGILFWNTVKRRKRESDGRNFLIYPWFDENNLPGPFSSIRLKAIQRGAQDFEYFKFASQYRDVLKLVQNAVEGSAEEYREVRKEMAAIITTTHRRIN